MAKISSFRGYRYNPREIDDLNKVVTQPYDNIDDNQRDEYYNHSEYNIIRIIKGKQTPNDHKNDNQYTRAADFWEQWIEDRILIREPGPAIFPYLQEYTVEGKTHVRKGLVVLVDLEDKKNEVRAHENTLSGPKADRLKLMKATEANDGQIFMLYDDAENRINEIIDTELRVARPLMEVMDDDGAKHTLYRISKPGAVKDIAEILEDKDLFIADGHHRYETAVNYLDYCRKRNWETMNNESFTHRMMTLVNIHDPGLTVLPTHRIAHSLEGYSSADLLSKAAVNFEVLEFSSREELYTAMDQAVTSGTITFGLGATDIEGYRLFKLKDPNLMDSLVEDEHCEAWRRLDVTVLHTAILDKLLGIDDEKLAAYSNVRYVRGRDKALDSVGSDGAQAAFLLNPTRTEQVLAVASKGERMPQKSTDYFPKLLTGMVMMKMTIDKSMGLALYDSEE